MIEPLDDAVKSDAAPSFMWAGSLISLLVSFLILLVVVSTVFEEGKMLVDIFPGIETLLTVKTFNLLYLSGVGFNFTLLIVYARNTEMDLTYGQYKKTIKHFMAYTLLGYGGLNLMVYVALLYIAVLGALIGGLVEIVEGAKAISTGKLDKFIELINKNGQK